MPFSRQSRRAIRLYSAVLSARGLSRLALGHGGAAVSAKTGQERFLFIHIPKSGGMSIRHPSSPLYERVIVPGYENLESLRYCFGLVRTTLEQGAKTTNMEHARWRDLRADVREGAQAFTVVRNPWSRCVSRYTYLRKIHKGDAPEFRDWLLSGMERHIGPRHFNWHRAVDGWTTAFDYVSDGLGNDMCTALRFEHYQQDVKAFFDLPADSVIAARNVSNGEKASAGQMGKGEAVLKRQDYRFYYDTKTHDAVAAWYAKDIAHWGFGFDTSATRNTFAEAERMAS